MKNKLNIYIVYTLEKFRNGFTKVLSTWTFKYGAPVQIHMVIKLPTSRVHFESS